MEYSLHESPKVPFCFDSAQSLRFCLFAGVEGESAHEGAGSGLFTLTGSSRRKENGRGKEEGWKGGGVEGRAVITCVLLIQGSGGGREGQPTVTLTHLPAGRPIGPGAKHSGSKM